MPRNPESFFIRLALAAEKSKPITLVGSGLAAGIAVLTRNPCLIPLVVGGLGGVLAEELVRTSILDGFCPREPVNKLAED